MWSRCTQCFCRPWNPWLWPWYNGWLWRKTALYFLLNGENMTSLSFSLTGGLRIISVKCLWDLKRAPHRKVLCVDDGPISVLLKWPWWPVVWVKAKRKEDALKQRAGFCSRQQEMGFLKSVHTKTMSRLYLRYLGCYSALCIGNSSVSRENKELKTQFPYWNLEAVSSLGPVYPSVWQGFLRHLLHEALWINGMQECWEVHLIPCELKAWVSVDKGIMVVAECQPVGSNTPRGPRQVFHLQLRM